MVSIQLLGVPWQLTTEYGACSGSMRVCTNWVGTSKVLTPGLIFAKILDNAPKSGKNLIFLHFQWESWNETNINWQPGSNLVDLQSESILQSSFQSYLGFNFFLLVLFNQNFHRKIFYEKSKFSCQESTILTPSITLEGLIPLDMPLRSSLYLHQFKCYSKNIASR